MTRTIPLFAAVQLAAGIAAAAEPGLILRLGEGDARVARQVALYVPAGQAASAFTDPGQVAAVWEGKLNLAARSRLIFTLEGTGQAKLSVDGETLCDSIGTPSERKRLRSGEHDIKIEYTGPAEGAAQLRLFWEGRDFGKEPVPAGAFTHDTADPLLTKQGQLRHGHHLISERRCAACHGGEAAADGPHLDGVGDRLETAWLAAWIADPKAHRASARMPKLFGGDDGAQKAADIAHFLSPPREAVTPAAADPEAVKAGGHLFHDQGCIGCHTLGDKGDADRIALAGVGHKFRPGALAAFLRDPTQHHPATRMPSFGLDEAEGAALAAFLRSLAKAEKPPTPDGDPKRGELLFEQSGCINCHPTGTAKSALPAPKALGELASGACEAADFAFGEGELEAIAAALRSQAPRHVPAEYASHQYTALRCSACHGRDGAPAYRETFAGEVAHLAPPPPPVEEGKAAKEAEIPHLDHLGFKLLPEWRARLFGGEIDPKVRHWLPARMPAFPGRAAGLNTGFSHLAGLPDKTPATPAPEPAEVEAGSALAGITGFSCGTCHGIGDKPAFAVFEGEGPNFRDAGARLRGEYFHLWMNDPARLWPGTIMPKYATDGKTPLTQHYDGDATQQFDAIHGYLRSLAE